jgi:hypothetical protein
MAKITNSVSFKGGFLYNQMTISEWNKQTEDWDVYSLNAYFERFDGKDISLSIKEDTIAPTREDELDEAQEEEE